MNSHPTSSRIAILLGALCAALAFGLWQHHATADAPADRSAFVQSEGTVADAQPGLPLHPQVAALGH